MVWTVGNTTSSLKRGGVAKTGWPRRKYRDESVHRIMQKAVKQSFDFTDVSAVSGLGHPLINLGGFMQPHIV